MQVQVLLPAPDRNNPNFVIKGDAFGFFVYFTYPDSEIEAEIDKIKKEMERLSEVGTLEERITFAGDAFSRYPADCVIRDQLAACLFFSWEDTHDNNLLPEIETLCHSVI